ncbi:hypothetical protein [Nocardiopsis algeriensis]|uniref:ABC transport system permease protein n=1 Tax=Nocardiopsis algeriensis TaxID=1478215 RepID=A0A841IQ08_9ACTN|nr:hypothetical protein [Nocardiopsis algeriensis]MBB6120280.1 hypothetical protein [Nocardiopsis algeriensis]
MLPRIIFFTHTAFVALASIFSFAALHQYESVTLTVPSHSVWVTANQGIADTPQIIDKVEEFTADNNVSVAYEVPDLRDPGNIRHLYLSPGSPESPEHAWLEDGYPSFGHSMRTEVHPFTDLDHEDPRGFYNVFGSEEESSAFEAALSEIGLHDTFSASSTELRWTDFFVYSGNMNTALLIALLMGVTAVGSGVLLNAKNYAVLRLQGHGFTRILTRDMLLLLRFYLGPGACVAASVVLLLFLYNGLSQFFLFAEIAGWLLLLFLLVGFAAHASALGITHTMEILPALKGRIPGRPATVSAYAARIPAIILVLLVLSSVIASARNIQAQKEDMDAFEGAGQTSRIMISGSVDIAEMVGEMEPVVGNWIRQSDASGDMILAAQERGEAITPPGTPRPDFGVILVNNTYLEHQEILSPEGERYLPGESVRILLPPSLIDRKADFTAGVVSLLGGSDTSGLVSEEKIEVLPTAHGNQVFTYGSITPGDFYVQPFLEEPVIIALPNGAVLSDVRYTSYATQGAIVFPDPSVVEESISQPPFSTYVNGMQMVVTSAADYYAGLVKELRLESFNLVASCAVMLMTSVAVCVIHTRVRAQKIFARHISGWSFLGIHRRLLLTEGGLFTAFIGWATWQSITEVIRHSDPSNPVSMSPTARVVELQPVLAVSISALGMTFAVLTLAVLHRKIVREGSSQA